MSFTDPSADPVQPDAGQGGEGTSDAPYAEYLNRIPEEVRGQVEPVFKDWDANTTKKFQDHAEYRKTWEPYEQSGIAQLGPEGAQQAVQFMQALNDPETFISWVRDQYAPANGIDLNPPQQDQQYGSEFEYDDGTNALKAQLDQALSPIQKELQAFSQWREQQENQNAMAEAQRFIDGQMAELKQKHGDEFNDTAREWVERLVGNYIESDPRNAVPKAWADWQQLRNTLEKQTLQAKTGAGIAPESGGMPDTQMPQPKTFEDANKAALEMFKAANRAQ